MPTVAQATEQEVPLSGVLDEFRTALREEIDAARRSAAASGIQLLDGRRLGQWAGSTQYVFRVESALNLPDDSPGDLHVPGRSGRPLETTIVAVEGLGMTLSVAEDLGDYVPRATLQSDLTHLLRTLIQRVEGFAERENAAGARLLGERAPTGELPNWRVDGLNDKQAEAVASALGRNTTFIWGPPGTGKTRTIGKIGEQLVRAGRSALIVSHTNNAVDQALLEIARDLGDDLVDGSVLRVGEPRDQRLHERERLQAETHIRERSQELVERQEELLLERAGHEYRWHKDSGRSIYSSSDHWQEIRRRQLGDYDRCDRCRSSEHLEVHHLHYATAGVERPGIDLVTLCFRCHQSEEGLSPTLDPPYGALTAASGFPVDDEIPF